MGHFRDALPSQSLGYTEQNMGSETNAEGKSAKLGKHGSCISKRCVCMCIFLGFVLLQLPLEIEEVSGKWIRVTWIKVHHLNH